MVPWAPIKVRYGTCKDFDRFGTHDAFEHGKLRMQSAKKQQYFFTRIAGKYVSCVRKKEGVG